MKHRPMQQAEQQCGNDGRLINTAIIMSSDRRSDICQIENVICSDQQEINDYVIVCYSCSVSSSGQKMVLQLYFACGSHRVMDPYTVIRPANLEQSAARPTDT